MALSFGKKRCRRSFVRCDFLQLVLLLQTSASVFAWTCTSHNGPQSSTALHSTVPPPPRPATPLTRRAGLARLLPAALAAALVSARRAPPAAAYAPDPDPLREALYLVSRVQEATVLQERFVAGAARQDVLRRKMTLTLRLVEKNYRLLDQITFASGYVAPASQMVEATAAGYAAAEALQNAIEYVGSDLRQGDFERGQKDYLTANLRECRESLFEFLSYMPREQLEAARKRVEEENEANRDEFDGDSDAGVYNPIVLPWKNR